MALKIKDTPRTPFQARMEAGHEVRTGHPAEFVYVSADGMLWHRVALCCGDPIPDTAPTMTAHAFDREVSR